MSDIDIRQEFLNISENDKILLREFKPVLEKNIDSILDGFYQHISQYKVLAALFQSPERMKHAADMQKQHWLNHVFSGVFDKAYQAKVNTIGRIHQRIGLEPRWYMAGYCLALNNIGALVVNEYHRRPERLRQVLAAVNKAAFLDMDLSTSVYIEVNDQAHAAAIAEALGRKADHFEREVKFYVAEMTGAAQSMRVSASHLADNTRDTSIKSVAVAAAAEQAAMNIHAVTQAAEELSSAIIEISRQIQRSNTVTDTMHRDMVETNRRVEGLSDSTARIGQVVTMIQAIARQTNMLALNATIEAARAGEAGKGFVVVAGEVKNLALQTAKATDEINALVREVQDATADTVNGIIGISETIGTVKEISESIAAAVEQQGAATQEIARNIQQASTGTQEVSQTISQVSSASNENERVADGVSGSALSLSQAADKLEHQLDDFVAQIRAG